VDGWLKPHLEGIGLIIPITDAMKEPKKFPKVLSGVMIFLICEWEIPSNRPIKFTSCAFCIAVLFGGAGVLAYLTFGDQIQTVVIVNLDPRSKMVQAVSPF
jgi:proton-coupled amino acid transporter